MILAVLLAVAALMPKFEPFILAVVGGVFVSSRLGNSEAGIWIGIGSGILLTLILYAVYRSAIGWLLDVAFSGIWGYLAFLLAQGFHIGTKLSWTIIGCAVGILMLLVHVGHRVNRAQRVKEKAVEKLAIEVSDS